MLHRGQRPRSYFKDEALKELNRMLQRNPHCVTTQRSLFLKFRMQLEDWSALLRVVHSVWNHTKPTHCAGFARMTIFTGLSASSHLQAIFDSTKNATRTTQWSVQPKMARCQIVITSFSTKREQKGKASSPQEPMQTALREISFSFPLPLT